MSRYMSVNMSRRFSRRFTSTISQRGRATLLSTVSLFALAILLGGSSFSAKSLAQSNPPKAQGSACANDDSGITLAPGFCATVFADNIGHVRHMAVAPNGVLYVNTWSGRYFHNDTPPAGGFLVALKDTKGSGQADKIERFGDGVPQGSAGGSGIAFYNGAIYAEQNDKIIRYALSPDSIVPNRAPQTSSPACRCPAIIRCILSSSTRRATSIVDLGSATNSCQAENRMPNSLGHQSLHRARDPRRHLAL